MAEPIHRVSSTNMSISSEASETNTSTPVPEERDEVKELKRMSRKETIHVVVGRWAVTSALILTAVGITATTYMLLKEEQQNVLDTAYDQFSRTIHESALDRQRDLRLAMKSFSDAMTAVAVADNASWPFWTMPNFEVFANSSLKKAGAEIAFVSNYVTHQERPAYENWGVENHEAMVREDHLIHQGNLDRFEAINYHPFISRALGQGIFEPEQNREYYFPSWSFSPPPSNYGAINWNAQSTPEYEAVTEAVLKLRNETLITSVRPYVVTIGTAFTEEEHQHMHDHLKGSTTDSPHSVLWRAVHKQLNAPDSPIVATVGFGFAWDSALRNLLPDGVVGIHVVMDNTCGQTYTYVINGAAALYIGEGDLHDDGQNDYERLVDLSLLEHPEAAGTKGHCMFSLRVYPSHEFIEMYESDTPKNFAIVIASTFLVVTLVFFAYDTFVQRRNEKLIQNAARSNGLVTSLFPGEMREKILKAQEDKMRATGDPQHQSALPVLPGQPKQPTALGNDEDDSSTPLAELYQDTSVMFADLVGFTAWSDSRQPAEVFLLLETLYGAFDEIAERRRVYKVETIGDCYVAVTGCPVRRKDHAVCMARFAREILAKTHHVVRSLAETLGDGTGDLNLRVGIHSGPVTAGVLRGARSRFQLFGDTMNTTARLESNSKPGMIQTSQATADLLAEAGKSRWIIPREDKIFAKGKGEMQTYWLSCASPSTDEGRSTTDSTSSGFLPDDSVDSKPAKITQNLLSEERTEKTSRQVACNVSALMSSLKRIVAHRNALRAREETPVVFDDNLSKPCNTILEEFSDAIPMHGFNEEVLNLMGDIETIDLSPVVQKQMHHYVGCIATMYHRTPFHDFDHASQVLESAQRLLAHLSIPFEREFEKHEGSNSDGPCPMMHLFHQKTFGIASDPLAQFACLFAALIHDADHSGVPNSQLVQEKPSLEAMYTKKSVAEQNSFELGWSLFMEPNYGELRATICPTPAELRRFRALVVNCVLATDVQNEELQASSPNRRWNDAFGEHRSDDEILIHRQATVVLEHVIQAANIGHTMNHWSVYRSWNERLFNENYEAFLAGRSQTNPAESWYEKEIEFFGSCAIPLAKRLRDCGAFGAFGEECVENAVTNLDEWKLRGKEQVKEMVDKV